MTMPRPGGDPDHAAIDVARAIEVGSRGVDGKRRRPVVELLGLDRDECHPPLAVETDREPALLERVRGRELLADLLVERREIGDPEPIDELLLPGQEAEPRGIGGEGRAAGLIQPADPERVAERRRRVLIEAERRIEADDAQGAVGIPNGEPLRELGQLVDCAWRLPHPGGREHRAVVHEAVGVREHGHRPAPVVVLRVDGRRRREDRLVDPVPRKERPELQQGAANGRRREAIGLE